MRIQTDSAAEKKKIDLVSEVLHFATAGEWTQNPAISLSRNVTGLDPAGEIVLHRGI